MTNSGTELSRKGQSFQDGLPARIPGGFDPEPSSPAGPATKSIIRHGLDFVLGCRLENVMAVGVSATLLALLLSGRMLHAIKLGPLDFVFILLPIGILGLKALLGLLSSADADPEGKVELKEFFVQFFQPLVRVVRDWFPFFLLSASYYSLYSNVILRVNPHTVDGALARFDATLLGNQAAFLLEPWTNRWVTDFLNGIYFSHVLVFPGVALYFYLRKEESAFRRIMMGYLTLMLMALASYVLLPAVGPEKYFADRFTRDLHGHMLTRTVDYIIRTGRVSHDCFPSMHVGIPLLLVFYLRGYRPKLFVAAAVYVLLMCCATIYLRYHYVADVLASFIYVPAAYWLNDRLRAHWPGERRTESKPVALLEVQPGVTNPSAQSAVCQ